MPDIEQQEDRQHPPPRTSQATPQSNLKHLLTTHLPAGSVYCPPTPTTAPPWYHHLLHLGLEDNAIAPIPPPLRTRESYSDLFTIFFTCLLGLLPLPTGALATTTFHMCLRDASLVIIFFAVLTSLPPAFMCLGGYKTGMRQMIQARYSFGIYAVIVPVVLNAATIAGFALLSSVVGGQTIAAVNPDAHVNVTVGIVIVCMVSFVVTFCGLHVVHIWERYQWIVNLVVLVIAVGCGGHSLKKQQTDYNTHAKDIITYGGLIAGYFITLGGTASDYSVYHNPKGSQLKVFLYSFAAYNLPSIPLLILGAAIGGALTQNDRWMSIYTVYGIGGIVGEMLTPAGVFGKIVLVFLALSVIGNVIVSMYSMTVCIQSILPCLAKVHRVVIVTVSMSIMVPMSIKAAKKWDTSLNNFLSLIAYWAACFDAVLIDEIIIIRRMDWKSFEQSAWNIPSKLPAGIAAISACLIGVGCAVPAIGTTLYVGPLAKVVGDVGFEMAYFVTSVVYVPLRLFEIKWQGHK